MIDVAIVGATGYAGAELVRLLLTHPGAVIACVTSERAAGERLDAHCPWLDTDLVLEPFSAEHVKDCSVAFLAQGAGFAMDHAPLLIERGVRVIDLSADFRLRCPDTFAKTYGFDHRCPSPGFRVGYGLTERASQDELAGAELVANPGCYPTATLLALKPLEEAKLLTGIPVIDAKSGVSGAGRSTSASPYRFTEREGSAVAYAAVGHRHVPEIEQELGVKIRFTPHLLPVPRGMEVTIHAPVQAGVTRAKLHDVLRAAYRDSAFVRVVDQLPETKQVVGSNRCDIHIDYDESTGFAVVSSVIDNLIKGAAGQAIQNMNVMFGLSESFGLPRHGVWP